MRIAITVDPFRPGQDRNLSWFSACVFDGLRRSARGVAHRPLPWEEWVSARFYRPEIYAEAIGDADLIIGFELPPAIREHTTIPWVDIRRHPKCYDPTRTGWSIRASWCSDNVLDLPEALPPRLPVVPALPGFDRDSLFAMQVRGDAQMLVDGRCVGPADVIPALKAATPDGTVLWLCPHPFDPAPDWIKAIQEAIPQACVWNHGTYAAMASMRRMFTWTSSCGWEAPDFGCLPVFLGTPYSFSKGFHNFPDAAAWQRILASLAEAEEAA